MPNIVTKDMHKHMAEQFRESFTEEANTIYYVVASKSTPYDSDELPPEPENSVYGSLYKIYDEMIFGVHAKDTDVSFMIRYIPWENGRTYDMYDDKDPDLYDKDFYVVSIEPSGNHSIFKCIYNGKIVRGDYEEYVPLTFDQPMSNETYAGDTYYRTADGYVWKLMCVISRNEFEKFSSDEFMPVKVDPSISSVAKDGAIEHIMIDDAGTSYNAYAYGTIKQSAIAGNNLMFSLQTDENHDILTFDVDIINGTFVKDHTPGVLKKFFFKLSNGSNWVDNGQAVTATYYAINGTIIRVIISNNLKWNTNVVKIYQTSNNLATGSVVAIGDIVGVRRDLVPTLSSNSDFYTNSSFYIRHGSAAGQLRTITDYIVAGNDRRVVLNEPFQIMPDSTSRFEIGPRVLIMGDGTDSTGTSAAKAIAVMQESSNSIHSIEMVDEGKNYTYANVQILSNTGYMNVSTNEPMVASGAKARAIISPKGGHGKNPVSELGSKYVCISTEFDNAENSKIPVQNDYRSVSLLKNPLFYRLSLTIVDSALLFNDGEIVTQISGGATGEVYNRSGNTLILTNIRGFFSGGEQITTKRSTNNVTTNITKIDKNLEVVDQRTRCAINITSAGPTGNGFVLDEKVYQSDTNAIGYIHSITPNRIDLVNVSGTWNTSDDASGYVADMIGETSGAIAKISGVEHGDLVEDSGEFLYIENFAPVTRNSSQKEQIKIVMEF